MFINKPPVEEGERQVNFPSPSKILFSAPSERDGQLAETNAMTTMDLRKRPCELCRHRDSNDGTCLACDYDDYAYHPAFEGKE